MTRDEFVEKYLKAVDCLERYDWRLYSCGRIQIYISLEASTIYNREFKLTGSSSWLNQFAWSYLGSEYTTDDSACLRQICMTMFFDFVMENELYKEF